MSNTAETRTLILYYITDRLQFPGTATEQRRQLLERIADAARAGIDFVQLRERALTVRELEKLAREAVAVVRENGFDAESVQSQIKNRKSKILINSRIDVALAAGADGVHLTSTDMAASDARAVWMKAVCEASQFNDREFVVATSCHSVNEVRMAEAHGADFAVFAPVFEKVLDPHGGRIEGVGLTALGEACRAVAFPGNVEGIGTSRMPVLALGGVTLANAAQCIRAGAAGVAGIRLFQEGDLANTVAALRAIEKSG
jgi:thiamine-phosphate pyrophosphorylase